MEAQDGRSDTGRGIGAGAGRLPARALCLAAAIGLCLALAPAAAAAESSFTWAGGGSEVPGKWSVGANWGAASAPKSEEELATLTFPELSGCTAPKACYSSDNDLKEVSAESLHIDDGDNYVIKGEELELGREGLTASPEGGVSGALDEIEAPLELSKSQRWTVVGRGDAGVAKDGLFLEDEVEAAATGTALRIAQSSEAALVIGSQAEVNVGSVTIEGADDSAKTGFENGSVEFLGGELDSSDKGHVALSHISFSGFGEVGALSTADAALNISIGSGTEYTGLEASSVELDSASKVSFQINGSESSQLLSEGPIALAGATLALDLSPAASGGSCANLEVGSKYTLVSTNEGLSGAFVNAPKGAETAVPIHFPAGCVQARAMKIGYQTGSEPDTVTGTVVEAPPVITPGPEPAPALEGDNPRFANRSLTVSPSGTFAIKVKCAARKSARCTGTITVRTLHAVSTGASGGKSKHKPAVLTLAKGSFNIAGGKTKAVALRLSAAARKLLAHDRTLRARATIVMRVVTHGHLGVKHTTQLTVTLHAPKHKHGKG